MARYPGTLQAACDMIKDLRAERMAFRRTLGEITFELEKAKKLCAAAESERDVALLGMQNLLRDNNERLASELTLPIEAQRLSNIAYEIYYAGRDEMGNGLNIDEDAIRDIAVAIDLKVALARKCERLVLQIRYPQPDQGEPT